MAPIFFCSWLNFACFVFALATSVRLIDSYNGVFCENTQFSLSCGEAEKLKIHNAVFGRTNYFTCWNVQIYSVSCTQSVTATMQRLCDGRITCSGLASVHTFGDPCLYTYKYLTVEYNCEKMTTTTTTTTTTAATTSTHFVTTRPPPPTTTTTSNDVVMRVACDDTLMHLECPADKMLDILGARYGRMSNKICGRSPGYTNPCRTNNTITEGIVRKSCQWKKSCTFRVNNRTFGPSPCPVGVYKYLAVNYRCVGTALKFIVCENAMAELKCPDSKRIRVLSAYYGRDDSTTCPYSYVGQTNCRAPVTVSVSQWCGGKTKCLLVSRNDLVSSDPCPNTYKYLSVRYICE